MRDVAIDHTRQRLYVATEGDHLYFFEAGSNTEITQRVPLDQYGNRSFRTVAVDPRNPDVVYTAGPKNVYKTDAAVKRSTDAGETWEIIIPNDRTPQVVPPPDGANEVLVVRVNPGTGDLWATGGCYGVWRLPAGHLLSVGIGGPEDGAQLYKPEQIELSATVTANTYPITKVEFFNRHTMLGEDTQAPYSFTWSDVENGDHLLYAVVTDSTGATMPSASIRVSVASSLPPEVSLTSPADGEVFFVPADVEITAEASDTDGTIDRVFFFVDSVKVAGDSAAPYAFTWSNGETGAHDIFAEATDDSGLTVRSETARITIQRPLSYFEDFEDGLAQLWEPVDGLWKVEGGKYYNYSNLMYENCIYTGTTFALFEYTATLKGHRRKLPGAALQLHRRGEPLPPADGCIPPLGFADQRG